MPIYFLWTFEISWTIIILHAIFFTKEPKVTAKTHIDAITLNTPLVISLFGTIPVWSTGRPGSFGIFFRIFFTTTDNIEINNVILKILTTVVKFKNFVSISADL